MLVSRADITLDHFSKAYDTLNREAELTKLDSGMTLPKSAYTQLQMLDDLVSGLGIILCCNR